MIFSVKLLQLLQRLTMIPSLAVLFNLTIPCFHANASTALVRAYLGLGFDLAEAEFRAGLRPPLNFAERLNRDQDYKSVLAAGIPGINNGEAIIDTAENRVVISILAQHVSELPANQQHYETVREFVRGSHSAPTTAQIKAYINESEFEKQAVIRTARLGLDCTSRTHIKTVHNLMQQLGNKVTKAFVFYCIQHPAQESALIYLLNKELSYTDVSLQAAYQAFTGVAINNPSVQELEIYKTTMVAGANSTTVLNFVSDVRHLLGQPITDSEQSQLIGSALHTLTPTDLDRSEIKAILARIINHQNVQRLIDDVQDVRRITSHLPILPDAIQHYMTLQDCHVTKASYDELKSYQSAACQDDTLELIKTARHLIGRAATMTDLAAVQIVKSRLRELWPQEHDQTDKRLQAIFNLQIINNLYPTAVDIEDYIDADSKDNTVPYIDYLRACNSSLGTYPRVWLRSHNVAVDRQALELLNEVQLSIDMDYLTAAGHIRSLYGCASKHTQAYVKAAYQLRNISHSDHHKPTVCEIDSIININNDAVAIERYVQAIHKVRHCLTEGGSIEQIDAVYLMLKHPKMSIQLQNNQKLSLDEINTVATFPVALKDSIIDDIATVRVYNDHQPLNTEQIMNYVTLRTQLGDADIHQDEYQTYRRASVHSRPRVVDALITIRGVRRRSATLEDLTAYEEF